MPNNDGYEPKKRPSLKEEVLRIDHDILRLLMRRHNLLVRMQGSRGHLLPPEEKELREAWFAEATRYSSDPRLSSQLFALLSDIRFFPKPSDEQDTKKLRQGFMLAPSQKPVDLNALVPASPWYVHTWMLWAAFFGKNLEIPHCLMHDAQHAFCRALNDAGIVTQTNDDTLSLLANRPLQCKDLSIHCADDADCFSLFAAQYIVRPSRVRFTAEGSLKMANLSALAHFLPRLGTRLSYAVPKYPGFPIRLECSGVLPKTIAIPDNLPTNFVIALLYALPFAEDPVTVDFQNHPDRDNILDASRKLLQDACFLCGESQPYTLSIQPSHGEIPDSLLLPSEPKIVFFLLALPLLLGGSVSLQALLPPEKAAMDLLAYFRDLNEQITIHTNPPTIKAQGPKEPVQAIPPIPEHLLHSSLSPLLAGLCAGFALKGQTIPYPTEDPVTKEFFATLGIRSKNDGTWFYQEQTHPVQWNAPTAEWAMAYALAATCRTNQGFKLGNPGVMTHLWPKFWGLYNNLPGSEPKKAPQPLEKPKKRRIVLDHTATVPPLSES
ncbi:MAG: hypothetical protein IJS54_07210 [Desulfovibrio sp.]|nr:hypothetical protein [Desulfovibrio sp.]